MDNRRRIKLLTAVLISYRLKENSSKNKIINKYNTCKPNIFFSVNYEILCLEKS